MYCFPLLLAGLVALMVQQLLLLALAYHRLVAHGGNVVLRRADHALAVGTGTRRHFTRRMQGHHRYIGSIAVESEWRHDHRSGR
jgi:hypothetical protein